MEAIHHHFELFVTGTCILGLIVLGALLLLHVTGALREIAVRWTRCKSIDKFFIIFFASVFAFSAVSKSGVNWNKVRNGGADGGIGLVGIYTANTNAVTTVGGVPVTNSVPVVCVAWTNGSVTTETPVWTRDSDTNDWTAVVKNEPSYTAGVTNTIVFRASADYSANVYWWLGNDTPARVITDSFIRLTRFVGHGNYVRLEWDTNEPRAATFLIMRKRNTETEWTQIGETSSRSIVIAGFWLDKKYDYMIVTRFAE